ncbi:MAG: septum formation protein Maf [Clostridia bacterium]|nr:septum formation protein Maf [Clostridia bacterium]
MKKRLILASASPRRKELLSDAGFVFEIITSNADEVAIAGSPETTVLMNARLKAKEVFDRNSDAIVLGADTVVCLDGKILGKPKDMNDARNMIKSLSGSVHEVLTGYSIIDENGEESGVTVTKVCFRIITDAEIEEYIQTDEPYDKAGGYGIQDRAGEFVKYIDGDLNNVIGLPVCDIKPILDRIVQKHDESI